MTKVQADVAEVIRFIVGANGRMGLAAERYNKEHGIFRTEDELRPEDLLVVLSEDTGDLVDKLKIQTILNLFDTFNQTQLVLRVQLPDMKPHDVAALYTAQAQAFASLTKDKIEEAPQQPVDSFTAKNKFLDKLADYKNRKAGKPADDEAVS